MFFLDSTKSLDVVLGTAATTNQLVWTAAWADITTTTFVPGSAEGATNDTTPVSLVPAPSASIERQVKYLTIYNADTATAQVFVQVNDGSVWPMVAINIDPGQTLIYDEHNGWTIAPVATAAPSINYSPAAPADWSGSPLTVQQALDRLAAAVDGLLLGPIP